MMQPDDDRRDESQLSGLLREWQVPGAPASLERRVLAACPPPKRSWWRFLLSGSIPVPVPVACLLALLLTGAVWRFAAAGPAPCAATASAPLLVRCASPVPGAC